MADLYFLLKWAHIGAAAVAFGSNVTHFFWLVSANANTEPGQRANMLRLVKKIDDRLAVPAYVLMVACGLGMWLWQWPLLSSWLVASLLLTALLTAMGVSFGPFMQRWIRLAGERPAADPLLLAISRRLTWWWGAIVLTVPIILYFMVYKPSLW